MAHFLACFDRFIPEQPLEGSQNELARDIQRIFILELILMVILFIFGIITVAVMGGWVGTTYVGWIFLVAFGFYSVWKRQKSWLFIWIILSAISILINVVWVIVAGVAVSNLNALCASLGITCPTGWLIFVIILIVLVTPVEVWSTYLAWRLHPKLEDTVVIQTTVTTGGEEVTTTTTTTTYQEMVV
eukprot:TRINITY_DN27357_c0_g1_i1.p1 TRINITY_DN27357_c0_g1~~TRINITY_DN27357_c0_g1_i1.p1  ORF type:complete len:187 (+),score=30.56 TRINITY_DN27357_c0_g1_i1:50-610(+)